jgi:hypothetical protein
MVRFFFQINVMVTMRYKVYYSNIDREKKILFFFVVLHKYYKFNVRVCVSRF